MKRKANDLRLNSPRSMTACKHEGIDPEEIRFVPYSEFKKKFKGDVAKLRFKYHETRRRELVEIVRRR